MESNLYQTTRTMSSRPDAVTVAIPPPEELGKALVEPVIEGVSSLNSMSGSVGLADLGVNPGVGSSLANTDVDAKESDRAKFRETLVSVLSSPVSLPLDVFMAEADEYPHFVWQDLLLSFLSFQSSQANSLEESDEDPFGPYARQKMSHMIKCYPDIFQRELLRDSFQLEKEIQNRRDEIRKRREKLKGEIKKGEERVAREDTEAEWKQLEIKIEEQKNQLERETDQGRRKSLEMEIQQLREMVVEMRKPEIEIEDLRKQLTECFQLETQIRARERWGVLHAAVLLGQKEMVDLVRDPYKYREKIYTVLTTTKSLTVSDSFNLIRRAVLWRHMHKLTVPYGKVVSFMKTFSQAIKPSEPLKALSILLDNSAEQIEYILDPLVVILAWSSISWPRILKEFETSQKQLFKNILATLEKSGSSFRKFLTKASDQVELTMESLMELILRSDGSDGNILVKLSDGNNAVPPSPDQFVTNIMQRFFVDRLSERTPKSLWSPLHLAAARGDHEMVKYLIDWCDKILGALGDHEVEIYTRRLQDSFCDAKGMTPLHYAVLGDYKDVVESLTTWSMFESYVDKSDIFRRTAFQMACSKQERSTIVEQLMQIGTIDVNSKGCCSFTSLHWAVYSGSSEAIKVLISTGLEQPRKMIRANEKDSEGRHPYEMAARLESLAVKDMLKDIRQLLLNFPVLKDEVERWYRDRQVYVDASNSILVGAALIASVTYGGWLQPPLGDHQASTDHKVRLFWAFSSLSFFFAIATVMAGATAVLPVKDEYMKDAVDSIRRWLAITSFLMILSVACVLGAFAAAGFASASLLPHLSTNMIITTGVGSVVCGTIGLFFCYRLFFKVRPDWINMFREDLEWLCKVDVRRTVGKFLLPVSQYLSGPCPCNKQNSVDFGPDNSPLEKVYLNLSNRDTIPLDVLNEFHVQDGSKNHCLIREGYQQLESFSLAEAKDGKGIDTEGSLDGYKAMWRNLSKERTGFYAAINLTEKGWNIVKRLVTDGDKIRSKYIDPPIFSPTGTKWLFRPKELVHIS